MNKNAQEATQKTRWRFTLREMLILMITIDIGLGQVVESRYEIPEMSGFVHHVKLRDAALKALADCGLSARDRQGGGGFGTGPRQHSASGRRGIEIVSGNYSVDVLSALRANLVAELEKRECTLSAESTEPLPADAEMFSLVYSTETSRGLAFVRVLPVDAEKLRFYYWFEEYPLETLD